MSLPTINPDDIITSPQLPEPARVIQVIPLGASLRIMAVGVESNQFYDRTFTPDEITVRRVTFAADGERFRLAALAERIRAAAQYDPQFAIGVSQIEPLLHQIDAVYNYLLRAAHPLPAGRRSRRWQDDHGRAAAQGAGAARRC